MKWMYCGQPVRTPQEAEILPQFRQDGRYAPLVQEALNQLEPWKRRDTSLSITGLSEKLELLVVPVTLDCGPRIWAKHRGHRAKNVGLSPFVRTPPQKTNTLTIMVAGTPSRPLLVRVYAGEYRPPLPWQRKETPEERAQSGPFWRKNAYVYSDSNVEPGTVTTYAPRWFTK